MTASAPLVRSGSTPPPPRSLESPLAELVSLTRARVSTAFRGRPSSFDVAPAHHDGARRELIALLDEHSHLAGQFHALSPHRWSLLFAAGRRAVLPFHERGFSLVAWRDPIGPEDARREAVEAFRAYAERRGKHAIILGVSDRGREHALRAGYQSRWVGGEQMFTLAELSTKGKAGEKLRLAVNHARRLGLSGAEVFPLRDHAVRERISGVEEAWKRERPARRTASFLGTRPFENEIHRRYFAVQEGGPAAPRMEAFLVCSPVSRHGYYLQDLVRAPGAPRGAGELLSLTALETFARERAAFATMGIVPFFDPHGARSKEPLPAPAAWCVRRFDELFRFSGLTQFRSKFPATTVLDVHAVHWPAWLTPMAVWDIVQVVGR